MKLTTIWTIPAMTLRERFRRTWDEWLIPKIAYRLPYKLRFYSFIGLCVEHTEDHEEVPAVPYMKILERMPNP